jgi:hypothetical protein
MTIITEEVSVYFALANVRIKIDFINLYLVIGNDLFRDGQPSRLADFFSALLTSKVRDHQIYRSKIIFFVSTNSPACPPLGVA